VTTAEQTRVVWILWSALFVAVGLYLVTLVVIVPGGTPESPFAGVRNALLAVAALETLAVWHLHGRWFRSPGAPTALSVPSRYVVCWALAEAIALQAFVVGFLARDVSSAVPFFVWSAALLVALRPRPERPA
jgi:hypothetical protein